MIEFENAPFSMGGVAELGAAAWLHTFSRP